MSTADARRIGGEFELSTATLADAGTATAALPTIGAAHEHWLDTGRSALAVIAAHLAATAPAAVVWLPAYCCESVRAPFARRGLPVSFYGVGSRLDRIDAAPRPGDTLLFVHYFGKRNLTALERAPALRAAGVRLIEDCVQAALSTGVGQAGDHALTSWRKLLACPDGALLASRQPLELELDEPDEGFVSARSIGKLLRGDGAPAERFLPLFEASEARLSADHPRALSWLSGQLLRQADLAQVALRRRANFACLLGLLRASAVLEQVRPVVEALSQGEVPLGLPVAVMPQRRDALRRHLAGDAIFCPVHWDLSHVNGDGFDEERALSSSMLTLPIDQRYGERDMHAILLSLSTFFGVRP